MTRHNHYRLRISSRLPVVHSWIHKSSSTHQATRHLGGGQRNGVTHVAVEEFVPSAAVCRRGRLPVYYGRWWGRGSTQGHCKKLQVRGNSMHSLKWTYMVDCGLSMSRIIYELAEEHALIVALEHCQARCALQKLSVLHRQGRAEQH